MNTATEKTAAILSFTRALTISARFSLRLPCVGELVMGNGNEARIGQRLTATVKTVSRGRRPKRAS
ncbi:MAG: hypothetical protein JRI89_13460 [Deltaproteobacteria bacterium]|nr:hypothetical protein [Deltaproteobacteria bacterium]